MSRRADFRLLLGVDGSAGSERALSFVASLPYRPHDEVLVASRPAYVLAARPGEEGPLGDASLAARERADAVVELAVAHLRRGGVRVRAVACVGEDAVDGLVRTAVADAASIVVVGSRGRGAWAGVLLGSTARALAILSPVPVLVVRTASAPLRVLVATDGSPAAAAALAAFARLPQSEGASVELLYVRALDADDPGGERAAALFAAQRRGVPVGIDVRFRLARGHVAETVIARAEDIEADLVVLGTRGLTGPRGLLFGSTAERVLTGSRRNVLVAPPPR